MAGKKSFILYNDLRETLADLTDEQIGKIFRAVFDYVVMEIDKDFSDLVLKIVYKQITNQIVRDLERYDTKCKQMQANASKRKRRQAKGGRGKQIGSDTDTVNDSDIVTVNENGTVKKIQVNPAFKEIFEKWLTYKKKRGESYRDADSTKLCYEKLFSLSSNNEGTAKQIVEQSMANNWAGLFELKKDKPNGRQETITYEKID